MKGKISISETGVVKVAAPIQMRDFEIAELFGVMVPTVKGKIKQILKEGVCVGDFSTGGIVVGNTIMPDYYELDMVVAIAFRIQSHKAELFRQWVMHKCIHQPIVLQYNCDSISLRERN